MPSEIEVIRAALKANPEGHKKLREMLTEGKLVIPQELSADEPLTIVAAGDHCGINGAKRVLCACGTGVWLSPSTQAMIKARGAAPTSVICPLCLIQSVKDQRERPNA